MIHILLPILLSVQPGQPTTRTFEITAYCPCSKCCGTGSPGITASGKKAVGRIIAAPKSVKFGTRMWVPGYGLGVVEDRGGAIKGNRLDLLFSTHKQALKWGRQKLLVIVLPD